RKSSSSGSQSPEEVEPRSVAAKATANATRGQAKRRACMARSVEGAAPPSPARANEGSAAREGDRLELPRELPRVRLEVAEGFAPEAGPRLVQHLHRVDE